MIDVVGASDVDGASDVAGAVDELDVVDEVDVVGELDVVEELDVADEASGVSEPHAPSATATVNAGISTDEQRTRGRRNVRFTAEHPASSSDVLARNIRHARRRH